MGYALFWIILSFAAAIFAEKRGRDSGRWLIISIFISPIISFIILLVLDDESENMGIEYGKLKKCPYCAESIKSEAIICKHCGKSQEGMSEESKNNKELNVLINKLKK